MRKIADIGAPDCVDPLVGCCMPEGTCDCALATQDLCAAAGGVEMPTPDCFIPGICQVFRVTGDVNGDSLVNLDDVDPFVRVLIGWPLMPVHVPRSDMDCDGKHDGGDIEVFLGILVP